MSYDMRYGVVWNVAKYGEYRDSNGNVVRRENCGRRPELGNREITIYSVFDLGIHGDTFHKN